MISKGSALSLGGSKKPWQALSKCQGSQLHSCMSAGTKPSMDSCAGEQCWPWVNGDWNWTLTSAHLEEGDTKTPGGLVAPQWGCKHVLHYGVVKSSGTLTLKPSFLGSDPSPATGHITTWANYAVHLSLCHLKMNKLSATFQGCNEKRMQ